ncbi:Protein of unknown function [Thermobacillus xylanilyticus]|uniref:Uncharacterized protein n=1 Tax=Thermobacillus xylanilyticus TaxID=76633 RepID=A0ABN7S929_THEXY|nr:Protein of unknown function [Thermobacillus xylanilyticus]
MRVWQYIQGERIRDRVGLDLSKRINMPKTFTKRNKRHGEVKKKIKVTTRIDLDVVWQPVITIVVWLYVLE